MNQVAEKLEKFYQGITVKMVMLAILGLMLLIPLEMIKKVIRERAGYADQTRIEIGQLWASSQTITGPVLNVPGRKVINDEGDYETTTLHIMPELLTITGQVRPEVRHRGIYETVVYETDIAMNGEFTTDGYETMGGFTYDWGSAYVTLGVSDNKGLSGEVMLKIGERSVTAEPGTVQEDIFERGITFPCGTATSDASAFNKGFSLSLGLRGSESLFFTPAGKSTEVKLTSDWNAPSFNGSFLPSDSHVTETGFDARWLVTHLNRNFPQAWTGEKYNPMGDAFGVNLIMEVDHYKKAERSAKYGLLFILFTFFVLLIIEFRSSERIHIFYYLLVAFALILFFSLLSALSEHVGFNAAYLISSVSVIVLLSAFFRSLLKKRWVVLLVSGLLTVLYLFIFILLALKDYAYLGGNIGLFIILAVLMMVSSRYRLFSHDSGGSGPVS